MADATPDVQAEPELPAGADPATTEQADHYGVFVKDTDQGRIQRTADTVEDAVQWAYMGWQQTEPATATGPEAVPSSAHLSPAPPAAETTPKAKKATRSSK